MNCPKCKSQNVSIVPVTETKNKTRWGCGCLFTWLAFLFPKRVSKTHTEAVCQNCGKRWVVTNSQVKKASAVTYSNRNDANIKGIDAGTVDSITSAETPFYKTMWFMVLCGVVFPPAGIALVWLFWKDWDTKKKAIVSAIMAVWFVILLLSGGGDTDNAVSGTDVMSSNADAVSATDITTTFTDIK